MYQAVSWLPLCGDPCRSEDPFSGLCENPRAAGRLALLWLSGKLSMTQEEEVLDIDEEQYRKEHINTRLYGYLRVPKGTDPDPEQKGPVPLIGCGGHGIHCL